MTTTLALKNLTTTNQLTDFLSDTQAVAFLVISNKDAYYCWIQGELAKFRWPPNRSCFDMYYRPEYVSEALRHWAGRHLR